MRRNNHLILTFLLSLGFFLFSFWSNYPRNNNLLLEYRGPQDKPIPHLIFCTNTSDTTFGGYPYYSFKISEENFNALTNIIKDFIKAWKSSNDSVLGYYTYRIQTGNTRYSYNTDNKNDTKRLLLLIGDLIESKATKKEVQKIIDDIIERIW